MCIHAFYLSRILFEVGSTWHSSVVGARVQVYFTAYGAWLGRNAPSTAIDEPLPNVLHSLLDTPLETIDFTARRNIR